MSVNRKALKVGSTRVVDANLIYNRVLVLHQSRGIQLDKVLHHELPPLPTSMFDETGIMRLSTTKSTLKNKLQVKVPWRLTHEPQATIMNGCAILWIINWPSKGTVHDYVHNFASYYRPRLEHVTSIWFLIDMSATVLKVRHVLHELVSTQTDAIN